MKKKTFMKATALLMVSSMVLSMASITVYADEGDVITQPLDANGNDSNPDNDTITVENQDVIVSGSEEYAVSATGGGEVTVINGDVSFNSNYDYGTERNPVAVTSDYRHDQTKKPSEVTIDGNITSNQDGLHVWYGSKADIDGNITADKMGVQADGYSTANVTGNVTAINGVEAYNNCKVDVGGDVNAIDKGIYARVSEINVTGDVNSDWIGAKVVKDIPYSVAEGNKLAGTVGGSITAGYIGAVVQDHGTLKVGKDVSGTNIGILTQVEGIEEPYYDDDDEEQYAKLPDSNLIIVGGTIKSEGYAIYALTSDASVKYDPTIVVFKIEAPDEDHIVGAGTDPNAGSTDAAAAQENKNAINYIIKMQDNSGLATIDGAQTFEGYKTMKKGNSVTISLNSSDYYLQGSEAVTITQNPNGSYTVTLNSAFGGIDLQILKRAIDEATGGGDYVPQDENPAPEPPAPTIVVTNGEGVTPAATGDAITPARTVSFNISDVTPAQMKEAIVENISATPTGGALRIETDQVACLDTAMLQAFAERGDIDLELIFTYNGQKMRIVIPRGTDIHRLLDANGYCGFLRLAGILGFQYI